MRLRSEPGIFHLDTNNPPEINYSSTSCPTLLCPAAWTVPEASSTGTVQPMSLALNDDGETSI
eukprot:5447456-Karenia_brevis.AAC.1